MWMFLVLMVVPWMTWIICATDILDDQRKQQISKMVLDYLLGVLHVSVICSAQINIRIICIAMEVFTTALNESIKFYSVNLGDVAPKKSRLECKVCR